MVEQRSRAELARLREEFRVRADQAFDEMFGSDGQNGLVTFTEREDRACETTDALARWLMEEHLALDSAADPGAQVDCPICGGPVLYAAATTAHRGQAKLAWSLYEQWIRQAWSGQVKPLIAGLQAQCERLVLCRP